MLIVLSMVFSFAVSPWGTFNAVPLFGKITFVVKSLSNLDLYKESSRESFVSQT